MTAESLNFTIDHIVLRVLDLPTAVEFYTTLADYMEWNVIYDSNDPLSIGFRQLNGFTIWIVKVMKLVTDEKVGYLDHLAFNCTTKKQIDAAYNFCLNNEYSIITKPKSYPEYGNFYGFSFKGPEGIKLEFVYR